jgi:hypothetical protein
MAHLPQLLQTASTPLSLGIAQSAGGGAQPLAVEIPPQEQEWWCWCAVTAGICSFYDSNFSLRQCEVAARVLNQPAACANPDTPPVNVMHDLDLALGEFRHFKGPLIQGPLKFTAVQAEIDAGRPIGVRIRFRNTGIGHFTVIRGYRGGALKMLSIEDPNPAYDEREVTYDSFVSRYRGWGEWRQSYLTRP